MFYRFDNLCEKAQELEVEDDDEVNTNLEKFIPFSKDDVETLSHVKVGLNSGALGMNPNLEKKGKEGAGGLRCTIPVDSLCMC